MNASTTLPLNLVVMIPPHAAAVNTTMESIPDSEFKAFEHEVGSQTVFRPGQLTSHY
jgi:hypothetical protein